MPPTRISLDRLLEAPWALHPQTLTRIVEWGRSDSATDPAVILALQGAHDAPPRQGQVAVIPVYGVIEHRSDWLMEMFGGVSVDGLRDSLREALADPTVAAVVLDFDSPGGGVAGVTELANEIRNARGGDKPIVAVANAWAASAAYWLASQCDELVVTPSGQVGSIGVYAVHQDISRMLDAEGVTTTIVSAGPHKTEGNMFEPLTDEARADLQSKVDKTYGDFLADVASGRGVTVETVTSDFGGGRMLTAAAAVKAGMADRVETLGDTVQRLGRVAGRRKALARAEDEPIEELPFTERLAAFASEASEIVTAAEHRARSRAAADRPAFSPATETALRVSRDAIDALLAGKPPVAVTSGEPTPPPVAASPPRFASREAWLRHLSMTT